MRIIRQAHEETILHLVSALCYRDEETWGAHQAVGACTASCSPRSSAGRPSRCKNIRMAAPMHDLGKIGIPDAILKKPGKLSKEEFEVMKGHAVIDAPHAGRLPVRRFAMARDIALCHHERWDGTGYPRGWRGAIPESARILTIADVYDALTHRRVYHDALPEEQALAIMEEGRGTHFDPFLLASSSAGRPNPADRRRQPGRVPRLPRRFPPLHRLARAAAGARGRAPAGP